VLGRIQLYSLLSQPLHSHGPTLSERADRSRDADNSPTRGRFRAAWLGTTLALLCILASGLMLLLGASLAAAGHASSPRPLLGMPPATLCSGLALLATWLAVPAASFSAGPFWALHHASQPAELRAVSVPLVNSIGNLGGFVGPYTLGALHALGPGCPPPPADHTFRHAPRRAAAASSSDWPGECVESWGWGTIIIAFAALIGTALTAFAAGRVGLGREGRYSGLAPRLTTSQPLGLTDAPAARGAEDGDTAEARPRGATAMAAPAPPSSPT